jgi:type I restriction enzyme, S subunit
MDAEQLLEHFDRVAEAPGSIAALRRFILDLAVRGKLVDQDLNDEPASELLKRIQAKKEILVSNGEIKQGKILSEITKGETNFDIPNGWKWVRLGDIIKFSAGRTPSRHDQSYWNTGDYPWISIADMNAGEMLSTTKETVSEKAKEQIFRTEPVPSGTILMSFKLTIGKIVRTSIPAYHNEAIISIYPHITEIENYLFLMLPQFARGGNKKDAIKGATLNRESISNITIPLPPLNEQYRIIAKVDELMDLCDRLETAQKNRENLRDRLVAASLHQLNQSADSNEEFFDRARFYFDNLAKLSVRSEHIKQLRNTILNLALCGRLTSQDSSDEPASEILKQIQLEKIILEKKGKIKKEKPLKNFIPNDIPFDLPTSWIWARIQEIFVSVTDGDHLPPPKSSTGIPLLVIGNVKSKSIEFDGCRHVPEAYYQKLDEVRQPVRGDILYTLVGSYGIPIIVRDDRLFCVQRHIGILRPAQYVNVDFLAYVLESRFVFDQATKCATGIAQKTVTLTGLRSILCPLPPMAEQYRIVTKVGEMMALCDELESQLSNIQINSYQLLESLITRFL